MLDFKRSRNECVINVAYMYSCLSRPMWRNSIGGFLMHLTLGSLYVWGNITNSVTSHLRKFQPDVTYNDTNIVFGTALGIIGFGMIIGGLIERFLGSKNVALVGGSCIVFGCLLSSMAESLGDLILTQGAMFGLGFGITFAAPISCAVRWEPDKKGLLTGIISSGIGCGSFLFGYTCNYIVNPYQTNVEVSGSNEGYFEPDSDVSNRVPLMYLCMGGMYACLVLVGYALLIDRTGDTESEYKLTDMDSSRSPMASSDSGYDSTSTADDDVEMLFGVKLFELDENANMKTAATADNDTSMNSETEIYLSTVGLDQLYKDPQAWLIALCFTLTTATGMYIAGTYKTFGQKFINNETFLTSVGAASSLFNMVGRLLWGIIGDRYGAMNGQLLLSFFFSFLLGLYFITENFDPMFYAVWTCLIFLFESGNFTLYLSMIIYLFGAKHAATNYGAIFFVYSMLNVCNISVLSYLNLEFPRICMVLGCTTFCGFIGVLILKRRTYGYTIRFDKK